MANTIYVPFTYLIRLVSPEYLVLSVFVMLEDAIMMIYGLLISLLQSMFKTSEKNTVNQM